jgi:hypothetical protein
MYKDRPVTRHRAQISQPYMNSGLRTKREMNAIKFCRCFDSEKRFLALLENESDLPSETVLTKDANKGSSTERKAARTATSNQPSDSAVESEKDCACTICAVAVSLALWDS